MKRMQAFRQPAHILPLLELAKTHRTGVLTFTGFASLFTILVRWYQLYERVLLANQCSFFLRRKQGVPWAAEPITALAPPKKDAVVDHEHGRSREDADEGDGEAVERDS